MKRIYQITGTQIRERANLITNNTGVFQPSELFFVQLDDEHAVDNTGAIFQLVDKNSAQEVGKVAGALQYIGESGVVYNYAEDRADFAEDSEDIEIYAHCREQAELLFDEMTKEEFVFTPNLVEVGVIQKDGTYARFS